MPDIRHEAGSTNAASVKLGRENDRSVGCYLNNTTLNPHRGRRNNEIMGFQLAVPEPTIERPEQAAALEPDFPVHGMEMRPKRGWASMITPDL